MTDKAKTGWIVLLGILVYAFLTLAIWTADTIDGSSKWVLQGLLTGLAIFAISVP